MTTAKKIFNAVIYGNSQGYGYEHPTAKEKFEQARKDKELSEEANAMCPQND